jgi:hypothetical protein
MGLREYMTHLSTVGVVQPPAQAENFIEQYEYARFSTNPLTAPQFDRLMSLFAQLLSGLTLDLDLTLLHPLLRAQSPSPSSTTTPSSSLSSAASASSLHHSQRASSPSPSSVDVDAPPSIFSTEQEEDRSSVRRHPLSSAMSTESLASVLITSQSNLI